MFSCFRQILPEEKGPKVANCATPGACLRDLGPGRVLLRRRRKLPGRGPEHLRAIFCRFVTVARSCRDVANLPMRARETGPARQVREIGRRRQFFCQALHSSFSVVSKPILLQANVPGPGRGTAAPCFHTSGRARSRLYRH